MHQDPSFFKNIDTKRGQNQVQSKILSLTQNRYSIHQLTISHLLGKKWIWHFIDSHKSSVMHFQHVDSVIMYVLVVVAGYYWMIGIHTIYIWHGNVSYHYSLYEWSKNVVTEAISILLRAIMRTTMRNDTYDTRLGVFISVMDRNNFHIIQTSMFLESDTPKEQNLRLVNMKVSMYFLLENLSCERFMFWEILWLW